MKGKLEMMRIRKTLRDNRLNLSKIIKEIDKNRSILEQMLNDEDYEWLQKVIQKSYKKEKEKLKTVHIEKFRKLLEEKKRIEESNKK